MSVYVGIDVHRKRSQVAVVTEDGKVELNKNVVNGSEPMLRLIGGLPAGERRMRGSPAGCGIRAGPGAAGAPPTRRPDRPRFLVPARHRATIPVPRLTGTAEAA
jgi:hypothetical protein